MYKNNLREALIGEIKKATQCKKRVELKAVKIKRLGKLARYEMRAIKGK